MADRRYGRTNEYICTICGWKAVTVDLHEGTTPFLIGCENGKCGGLCRSAMYRVEQEQVASHEWYRPLTAGERKAMRDPSIKEHVKAGGLLLRKVKVH